MWNALATASISTAGGPLGPHVSPDLRAPKRDAESQQGSWWSACWAMRRQSVHGSGTYIGTVQMSGSGVVKFTQERACYKNMLQLICAWCTRQLVHHLTHSNFDLPERMDGWMDGRREAGGKEGITYGWAGVRTDGRTDRPHGRTDGRTDGRTARTDRPHGRTDRTD